MRRYVYSPRVWIYVNTGGPVGSKKNPPNVVDLSAYTTSGTVNRLVGQVSTAEVTIRNPHKKWTRAGNPTFRPMDPITIFMMREKGFPVQVFTGYLDRTPYYAMYPGTVTLMASCTLKRLVHKYFDPALPYTFEFLSNHGWFPNGSGAVVNLAAEVKDATSINQQDVIEDSGFGSLLFSTLTEIGGWDKKQIYIEQLPNNIAGKVGNIFRQFADDDKQAKSDYETLLYKLIGVNAQGSGGGNENNDSQAQAYDGPLNRTFGRNSSETISFNDAAMLAEMAGLPGYTYAQIAIGESGLRPGAVSPDGGFGLWQMTPRVQSAATVAKWEAIGSYFNPWHCALMAKVLAGSGTGVSNYYGVGHVTDFNRHYTGPLAKSRLNEGASDGPTFEGANGALPVGSTQIEDTTNSVEANEGKGDGTKIRAAAKAISDQGRSYSYGAGHGGKLSSLGPSDSLDCSSSTSLALKHAGMFKGDSAFVSGDFATNWGQPGRGTEYTVWANAEHVFIQSEGSDKWRFDTGGPGGGNGPRFWTVWRDTAGFTPRHWAGPTLATTDVEGGGASGGATIETQANAAAFAAVLNWPSLEETTEATMLQGAKSLMNDKSLLPFIEQMTGASLRQFQSLPNGTFFAFYPDYFGEMGHRKPYWDIDDVEILDGGIDLTDDNLVTHQFVVGDTIYGGGITLIEKLQAGGVVSVFNAFGKVDGQDGDPLVPQFDGKNGHNAAVAFLQKYGARPDYTEAPMVRSPYFEAFLAYQKFMQAWAKQFATNFTFTFMPELYPGGRVGFPSHGLQLYIESVTHSWDYSSGFTTGAVLSSPSAYGGTGDTLKYSNGLVRDTNAGTDPLPNKDTR